MQSARRQAATEAAAAATLSARSPQPHSDFDSDRSDDDDAAADADDAAALEAQLDAELAALRSLRDEDVGIRPDEADAWRAATDGASTGDADRTQRERDQLLAARQSNSDEEDEEFAQLLTYKPRCTFRPRSARANASAANSHTAPHAAALSPRADTTVAATAAHSGSALGDDDELGMPDFAELEFAIDGRPVRLHDDDSDFSGGSATPRLRWVLRYRSVRNRSALLKLIPVHEEIGAGSNSEREQDKIGGIGHLQWKRKEKHVLFSN